MEELLRDALVKPLSERSGRSPTLQKMDKTACFHLWRDDLRVVRSGFARASVNKWACLAIIMALIPAAMAQQNSPHIGYVYPAGGKQGSTFEVVVGGQYLGDMTNVFISGGGIQAAITNLVAPITGKDLNDLRIQIDELLARKAVVSNDFKALENFRSFKNAKTAKPDSDAEDKELQELKQKYAGAKWTDEDEKLLATLRKKLAAAVRRPANPAISEIAMLRVTVEPGAAAGAREIRLGSPRGLTNPLLFKICQLEEFTRPPAIDIPEQKKSKEEPKRRQKGGDADGTAMAITLPAILNGQILPGAADRFRFAARKGMNLVVASSARELIPYLADAVPGWFQATLTLFDAAGREVAYDDDFRFNPDPVLYYEIPADGDYVLEIKDSIYRGREDFVYRITVGELPFITGIFPLGGPTGAVASIELTGWNLPEKRITLDCRDKAPGIYPVSARKDEWISNIALFAVDGLPECLEKEANSQRRTAQSIRLPLIINGRIGHPSDRDFFRVEGKAGDEIVAEVYARRLNSPLDSKLKLLDADGGQVAVSDDSEDRGAGLTTHHADSFLCSKLPKDGIYYVEVTDTQHQGGPEFSYRLRVSQPRPDFALRVVPSSINLRAGGTVPVTIYAVRCDGFTNTIAIGLKDAPEGFKLSGSSIHATQSQVRITLTAPPSQKEKPVQLNFEGRATVNGQVVVRPAVPAEDMMQAFAYRHLVPSKELLVGIGARYLPKSVVKIISKLPVMIPAGGTAAVKFGVPSDFVAKRMELELSEPPDGITIQKVSKVEGGLEVVFAADSEKVKAGHKGNLIVAGYAERAKTGESTKPAGKAKRVQVTTVPAMPFEITAHADNMVK